MNEDELSQNFSPIFEAIEVCIEKKLFMPALILIYSGIDIAGWLADEKSEYATKQSFMAWADRYLLSQREFFCNSLDLYAARCAVVHTLTSYAKLIEKGKARIINYAWGTTSVDKLQQSNSYLSKPVIAVNINELFEAFHMGVTAFINEISKDSLRAAQVFTKANKFFIPLSEKFIDAHLRIKGSK